MAARASEGLKRPRHLKLHLPGSCFLFFRFFNLFFLHIVPRAKPSQRVLLLSDSTQSSAAIRCACLGTETEPECRFNLMPPILTHTLEVGKHSLARQDFTPELRWAAAPCWSQGWMEHSQGFLCFQPPTPRGQAARRAAHPSRMPIKQKLKGNYMGKPAARRRGGVVITWLLVGLEFCFNALGPRQCFLEKFSLLLGVRTGMLSVPSQVPFRFSPPAGFCFQQPPELLLPGPQQETIPLKVLGFIFQLQIYLYFPSRRKSSPK